jgi:ABC-type polysaccharide/polyol phosphate transport system ATPase subunit
LTGLDNFRFICRVYGVESKEKEAFVADFSELGVFLNEPVKSYSSGMRARLAFALSMVIDFDCFLIDEIIAVGDGNFHRRCMVELFEKRADKAKIIVSHNTRYIRDHCTRVSVLSGGKLHHYTDLDAAIAFYEGSPAAIMQAA